MNGINTQGHGFEEQPIPESIIADMKVKPGLSTRGVGYVPMKNVIHLCEHWERIIAAGSPVEGLIICQKNLREAILADAQEAADGVPSAVPMDGGEPMCLHDGSVNYSDPMSCAKCGAVIGEPVIIDRQDWMTWASVIAEDQPSAAALLIAAAGGLDKDHSVMVTVESAGEGARIGIAERKPAPAMMSVPMTEEALEYFLEEARKDPERKTHVPVRMVDGTPYPLTPFQPGTYERRVAIQEQARLKAMDALLDLLPQALKIMADMLDGKAPGSHPGRGPLLKTTQVHAAMRVIELVHKQELAQPAPNKRKNARDLVELACKALNEAIDADPEVLALLRHRITVKWPIDQFPLIPTSIMPSGNTMSVLGLMNGVIRTITGTGGYERIALSLSNDSEIATHVVPWTHIHELTKTDEHGHVPGWYFSDETDDLNGPFDTQDQAKEALDHYIETLK